MRQGIGSVILLCVAAGAHATTIYETGFDGFDGTGFVTGGAPGALDSALWRAGGLSEGDGVFDGTFDRGDFARGASPGGVGSGGVYAFSVGTGDRALGMQATGSDMTPGFFELRVANGTDRRLTAVDFAYRLYVRNDGGRTTAVSVGFQDANGLLALESLSAATPATADAPPGWLGHDLFAAVVGLDVAPGANLGVRWTFDDLAGRGARDELAIDDVLVRVRGVAAGPTPVTEPASATLLALGALGAVVRRRRRGR